MAVISGTAQMRSDAGRVDEATEMAIRRTAAEMALLEERIDAYDKELARLEHERTTTIVMGIAPHDGSTSC